MENKFGIIFLNSRKNEVKVFVQSGPQSDFGGGCVVGFVVTPLGKEGIHQRPVFVNSHQSSSRLIISIIGAFDLFQGEGVFSQTERITRNHFLLCLLIESGARQANEQADHSQVHDISAIAAGVSERQNPERFQVTFTLFATSIGSSMKLGNNGAHNKNRQHEAYCGVKMPHSESEKD